MWKTATFLAGAVLVLLTLGIVMLASTSGVQGETLYGDSLHFVKRQAVWLFLGIIAALAASRINYEVWRAFAVPMAVFVGVLLVMTVIPGVGVSVKGSSRWLQFGPLRFQPSEFAKLSTTVLLAWWMGRNQRRVLEFTRGMLIPMSMLGFFLLLIFVEPDFGTTLLVGSVGMIMMFLAGTRVGYLLIAACLGLTGFAFAVMRNAERMRRIIAFLNPEKYARDEAFQLLNAMYAFIVGGGSGVGLGQSLQKHFYLPEAHTDFIFAIIGEELGLTASLLVVVLYLVIFICGIRISLHAPDIFSRLLSFGVTLMITFQAVINIGVVTGCLPTKGLPLPFISSGGSSLVVSMTMIGILFNIANHSADGEDLEDKCIRDQAHRF